LVFGGDGASSLRQWHNANAVSSAASAPDYFDAHPTADMFITSECLSHKVRCPTMAVNGTEVYWHRFDTAQQDT
jgi:hypothetical protein